MINSDGEVRKGKRGQENRVKNKVWPRLDSTGVFTPLQRCGGEKACRSRNSLGTKRSGSVGLRIKHE